MKKALLFLAFVALCCSFTIIKYHKTAQTDATFEELLTQFPKGTLPFTLSKEVLLDESFKLRGQSIESKFSSFFPRLTPVSRNFSRMPSLNRGITFRAFETPDRYILVYRAGFAHANFYAAIFTKKGEYLGEQDFAHVNRHSITDTSLDENLNLTRSHYTIVRETDRDGYETANIIKFEVREKTTISLAQNSTTKPVIVNKDAERDKSF